MNQRHVWAMFRRHWIASIYSPPRLIDMVFWPVVDVVLWGVMTTYLERQNAQLPIPLSFLLGGLLLWDLVFRSKNGIAVAFLSEGYWRNAINLLASPLTSAEYLAGLVLYSLTRTAVSWVLITALAWALFSFGVLSFGAILGTYVVLLLVFGVAMSFVVLGLVLRFGPAADEMAWAISGFVAPFAAVFYPLAALPGWARAIAAAMPPAHIFESMRSVLAGRPALPHELVVALVLDVIYLAGSVAFANAMFDLFRRRGYVTRYM